MVSAMMSAISAVCNNAESPRGIQDTEFVQTALASRTSKFIDLNGSLDKTYVQSASSKSLEGAVYCEELGHLNPACHYRKRPG